MAEPGSVVALSGGVGGAKLVHGLALSLPAHSLSVVVNTGDDFRHYGSARFGLAISPDLDTVMYTLAGLSNPSTGWGLAGDTAAVMEAVSRLGAPPWFHLGDRDLATHLLRSQWLDQGLTLTEITDRLAGALGVGPRLLPMCDQPVATRIRTDDGELAFQEWFVRRRCQPPAKGVAYAGAERAKPSPAVLGALETADLIVIGPSNPFLSIGPILALPGLKDAILGGGRTAPVVGVSPLIGGRAVKGPAADMMRAVYGEASAMAIAQHYGDLVDGWVIDQADAHQVAEIRAAGFDVLVAETLMHDETDRRRLAETVLAFGARLRHGDPGGADHSSTTMGTTEN